MNRSSQHSVILDTKLSGTEFSGTSKKFDYADFVLFFRSSAVNQKTLFHSPLKHFRELKPEFLILWKLHLGVPKEPINIWESGHI